MVQLVNNQPAMQETRIQSLGQKDPLEKRQVTHSSILGLPGVSDGKKKKIHLQCRRPGFNPWVGKILWRRERQATPVFWPGESHGQRSLTGYRVHGVIESDMTEQLPLS